MSNLSFSFDSCIGDDSYHFFQFDRACCILYHSLYAYYITLFFEEPAYCVTLSSAEPHLCYYLS